MHTPLKLNTTKLTKDSNPMRIMLQPTMLGISSLLGQARYILTESIIKVRKNPLTAVAQANK
jgi:hypothetical protein